MRLYVFEDDAVKFLEPLTLTRPAWALLCGVNSLLERQQRALGAKETGALVRPELLDLCRLHYPGMPLNDAGFFKGDNLILVNARWLAPASVAVDMTRPHLGLVEGQIAYVALPPLELADQWLESTQACLDKCHDSLPAIEAGGSMVELPCDLVDRNPEVLVQDWHWFADSLPTQGNPLGAGLVGPPEKLVVAEDAVLEPFVVADTRQGPVFIDRGALVHSFSRLEGPCYIGKETWIMGANLRGGTIGPKCRIGGEVEASLVQGHSNKYHDGFLGHSYLGEWVNLAAGTQTSDLRNDYGPIRITVAGQRIATGRTKIGTFIGDHSKTALGALLNTGTVIGAFSNVLPSGFLLPTVIPSFCQVSHGHIQERQDMRQLFTTAATVMRRRGETFTDIHRDFFFGLYDHTARARQSIFRETEARQRRRV